MAKKDYNKIAKITSLIPFITFFVCIFTLFMIAICGESVFPNDFLEKALIPVYVPMVLILYFGRVPTLILGIVGIVTSIKSIKENKKGKAWLVISIIDIVVIFPILMFIFGLMIYPGMHY